MLMTATMTKNENGKVKEKRKVEIDQSIMN